MKKIVFVVVLFLTLFSSYAQGLKEPAKDKAMVYFVRPSSLGMLINFKYFDGETYLGKFNHGKYMAYECNPGTHLFWAKSENIDYIEADLEAGKSYVIIAEPQMGAIKAGVQLKTLDKGHKKYEKTKKKVLESIAEDKLYILSEEDKIEEDVAGLVKKAMEKYQTNKDKGKEIAKLTLEMYLEK